MKILRGVPYSLAFDHITRGACRRGRFAVHVMAAGDGPVVPETGLVAPEIGHDLGLHIDCGIARIHFIRACRRVAQNRDEEEGWLKKQSTISTSL